MLELVIYHDGGDNASCSDGESMLGLHSLTSEPDEPLLVESRWEIQQQTSKICDFPDACLRLPQRQRTRESITLTKQPSDAALKVPRRQATKEDSDLLRRRLVEFPVVRKELNEPSERRFSGDRPKHLRIPRHLRMSMPSPSAPTEVASPRRKSDPCVLLDSDDDETCSWRQSFTQALEQGNSVLADSLPPENDSLIETNERQRRGLSGCGSVRTQRVDNRRGGIGSLSFPPLDCEAFETAVTESLKSHLQRLDTKLFVDTDKLFEDTDNSFEQGPTETLEELISTVIESTPETHATTLTMPDLKQDLKPKLPETKAPRSKSELERDLW